MFMFIANLYLKNIWCLNAGREKWVYATPYYVTNTKHNVFPNNNMFHVYIYATNKSIHTRTTFRLKTALNSTIINK